MSQARWHRGSRLEAESATIYDISIKPFDLKDLMARAVSTSTLSKTLLSDGISFLAQRRGFAAAAEAVRRSPAAEDKAAAVAQLLAGKRDPDPWVPDPVTGYYRPWPS
ncbi:hypothetical protein LUZ61_007321 [Rhynchospora tenuis]|uniref:Uncharacterized protein n=1 Tax=Rhynchospora tenuis TaxID=198213 RepID=A0AAD6EWE7_9POAL|nr:hypothetical protein LUZ61_007321 [Rhynchospora tenuis]